MCMGLRRYEGSSIDILKAITYKKEEWFCYILAFFKVFPILVVNEMCEFIGHHQCLKLNFSIHGNNNVTYIYMYKLFHRFHAYSTEVKIHISDRKYPDPFSYRNKKFARGLVTAPIWLQLSSKI